MPSAAWTTVIRQDRVQEFRDLIADLNADLSGLAERARDVGYHRERMWLQPNEDGSAQLIIYLEYDEGVTQDELFSRLQAYDSEFTRWWTPRFRQFGVPTATGETVVSWDDDG